MFYDNELLFLREVFRKSHVPTAILSKNEITGRTDGETLLPIHSLMEDRIRRHLADGLANHTVYRLTDEFGMRCIYFLLPSSKATALLIGPFLTEPLTHAMMLEIGERNGISPGRQRFLEEFIAGIPVLSEGNPLFVMLSTFCERIFESPSFAIVDVDREHAATASPLHGDRGDNILDDTLINMKAMEQRYAFENELIRAVSLGQLHKEAQLFAAFSERSFEKRLSDPLRNAKNYCIIMNTLLRKAAENGGVHPVYLDRVSSEFAAKIEQLPSLSANTALMLEMFRGYCRLVRKHNIKKFPLAVQKTILLIDSDLSAELSPKELARKQGLSPAYLSTVFKRETGKTITECIRDKRISHATHLLGTTRLQIQTVALHCGIMDVQYFSKIFKNQIGMTPKEYREFIQKK